MFNIRIWYNKLILFRPIINTQLKNLFLQINHLSTNLKIISTMCCIVHGLRYIFAPQSSLYFIKTNQTVLQGLVNRGEKKGEGTT